MVLHALTDAILGALADGDIGTHFPPSDPQWRGASSDRFLAFAVERVAGARRARRSSRRDAAVRERRGSARTGTPCAQRIAAIAGLRLEQVSVKATTTEKLGFTGRGEGIAAQAAATIGCLPEARLMTRLRLMERAAALLDAYRAKG